MMTSSLDTSPSQMRLSAGFEFLMVRILLMSSRSCSQTRDRGPEAIRFPNLDPKGPDPALTPIPLSHINLARINVQLLTPHLSPYLNTDSLFAHGFPSLIQRSSSKQPLTHSFQSSCPTQMPLDPYSRITRT